MKHFYFVLAFIVLFSSSPGFSQDGKHKYAEAFKKIEELRKIKIIETLALDEQTTLRFFARRSEHVQVNKSLDDSINAKLNEIENTIKSNSKNYKSFINEYLNLEKKKTKEKNRFINSLYDILSEEQIAKLVIFERKFHHEVKKILLEERMKHRGSN